MIIRVLRLLISFYELLKWVLEKLRQYRIDAVNKEVEAAMKEAKESKNTSEIEKLIKRVN